MKKILSLLCIVGMVALGFSETQAQDTRFGLKGGLTYYKGTVDVNLGFLSLEIESDSDIGFAGGVFAEFPISDYLSIQPEVLFMQKNSKEEGDPFDIGFNDFNDFDDFDDETAKTKLTYIDIPILFKVNIPMDGRASPFIAAGPYVGYLLDAKATSNGEEEDLKDFMKDINYGLLLSAGVNFGNFGIELRYDIGMANIIDEDALFDDFDNGFNGDFGMGNLDIEAKLSGLSVMASIRF